MNKAKLNYLVDTVIGIAFLCSAISGLVFLLPVSLGLNLRFWGQMHTWSSLVMICGVFLHLVLHWKWIVTMTKRTFLGARQQASSPRPAGQPLAAQMSRRRFLSLGAIAMASVGLSLVLCKAIQAARDVEADSAGQDVQPTLQTAPSSQPTSALTEGQPSPTLAGQAVATPTPLPQSGPVACPFGLVNDPYPGRCRRYTDRNGNGICDYSEPGSGIK